MSDRLDNDKLDTVGDNLPDVIKSLDDALKAIDDSNLSPAPSSVKPVIDRLEPVKSSLPTRVSTERPVSTRPAFGGAIVGGQKKPAPEHKTGRLTRPVVNKPDIGTRSESLLKLDDSELTMPNFNEPNIDTGSPEFKMKFDFEDVCTDVPENRPLRRRRERRTGLVGGLMFAIFILCISLVVASVMWMATIDVLGFATDDENVNVTVPVGFTMDSVTDILYEAGLIRYKALFNIYAEFSNAEEKISPGSYVLNKNFDYRAIIQGMTARAGVRVETTVTIPEGFTLAQIFALLENEEVCSAAELWDAATYHDFSFYFLDKETLGNRLRLEGFLFPDTYNFYKSSTPVQTLNRMLREFDRKFTEQFIERADLLGYTVREIIIIASMIEREAGSDEERPRIAAVIYNRLHSPNFPNLEIDATIHYIIAGTGTPFSISLDNEFNTYMYPGLPPGPISNPGLASIRAALYPMSTNEFYYALNRQGTHNFFTNFNDHINFVNSDQYGG